MRLLLTCAVLLLNLWTFAADAQSLAVDDTSDLLTKVQDKRFGFRSGSTILAPIPFENPTLGTGLALGAAYMFQLDPESETSTLALGGFRTSNGSEGYLVGGKVYFGSGLWSATLGLTDVALNYSLHAGGAQIPISQSFTGGKAEFERKFGGAFGVGLSLDYGETSIRRTSGGLLPPEFQRDVELDLFRVGLKLEHDRRDNNIYPTRGTLVTGRLTHGKLTNAREREYDKAVISAQGYMPVFTEGVLAAKATACAVSSSAPFFDSCAIGPVDGFRGYDVTEFIDDALFSLQLEYRGRLTKRLGYVVFAGSAMIGDSLGSALDGPYRNAAGVGLRIRLSRTYPVDYAIDYALNERGDDFLYISVGQRF